MFTDDGVFLEEGVVAFTAADLEDELTDVEQVVSTDTQLGRKIQKNKQNFIQLLYLSSQEPCMPL